jgi:hypothetical protein
MRLHGVVAHVCISVFPVPSCNASALSANRPECCARPYFKLGQRFLPRFVGLCLPLATSLGIVIVALVLVRRALKWRYPI